MVHRGPDLIGQRFGRYIVLERSRVDKSRAQHWLCKCECGAMKQPTTSALIKGESQSCGCLHKEIVSYSSKLRMTTHGLSNHPIHRLWFHIKDRCYNSNHKSYINYGGRGIRMCAQWLADFQNFYDWAINHNYQKGLQINRINNDGDYEPNNCEFTTSKVNNNNRRPRRRKTT